MPELQFIPLPDPRFPETMTPENIATLKAWGVIPQEVTAFASRHHWGSTPGTHGLFPEEGDTPKYWRIPPEAWQGSQVLVGDSMRFLFLPNSQREAKVYRSNTESAGFDHPVFEIYGQHTAQFYRDYAPLFDGRVPVIVAGTITAEEAGRINVKEGTPLPYPFGAKRIQTTTGWSFPTDCALRFRPGTNIVEAFRKEDFVRQFGDPAQYTQPAGAMASSGSMSIPKGMEPPPPAPPVHETATPAGPPPPVSERTTYEGMEQDNSTGEAICNGIRTGWYFERPMQVVPLASNPETGRQSIAVKPWGFATASTAQRVLEAMQVHTRYPLEIFKGDQNPQFPTSVVQRYIGIQGQSRNNSVNAGLIASQIARTTAEVSDGKGGRKIVQSANGAIAEAIASLEHGAE